MASPVDTTQGAGDADQHTVALDIHAMHAVIFVGQDTHFTTNKRTTHYFGIKLILALSFHMKVHASITHHAMILWTIALAKSLGRVHICVCVGCFMLANKIHDNSTVFSLQRFAHACGELTKIRSNLTRDLENALTATGTQMSSEAIHLKNQLKSIDALRDMDMNLFLQVGSISADDLKCAETTLLFKMLYDKLNFYLFYVIEYASDRLIHIPSSAQTESIQQMCLL